MAAATATGPEAMATGLEETVRELVRLLAMTTLVAVAPAAVPAPAPAAGREMVLAPAQLSSS